MEHAMMCPQCNAPLKPSRFAQSVVCEYCGATVRFDTTSVSVERFHQAFRVWNSPASYQIASWISIGESHWAVEKQIAHGDISDVYTGLRARWPTELAIIKFLRNPNDSDSFNNEWDALQILHASNARGADTFTALLPQPILHGEITAGSRAGTRVNIYRWLGGFHNTFEDVQRAYPQGIPPRASIWIWRRILEVLSFIHRSDMVHGAVVPSHLLVQENEHGVMLVGYSAAGRIGEKVRAISDRFALFYPNLSLRSKLTPQVDLVMSARVMTAILGGDPEKGTVPSAVPGRLARFIREFALADPYGSIQADAWSIREELGTMADELFGPPQFIPIVMPS